MFRELKFLIFPANLPFDVTVGEAADVYLVLSCECDVTVNALTRLYQFHTNTNTIVGMLISV